MLETDEITLEKLFLDSLWTDGPHSSGAAADTKEGLEW